MYTKNAAADYCKGFSDGLSVNSRYPQTLIIMGKTFDEICKLIMTSEEKKVATKLNTKFEYCGYQEDSSDRDFLGFIYSRLNQVMGEAPDNAYMLRLEKMIDTMPGKIRVGCDCSVADKCPQGRIGSQHRCSIWVDNKK